jgi:hypothetical protein
MTVMTGDASKLSTELRKALNAELRPSERVLYAAQPNWRAEWGKLLVIFLFGIGWSGIAFSMFGMTVAAVLGYIPMHFNGEPASPWIAGLFGLFEIPFLFIGGACLLAPYLAARKSKVTVHAVTDARLLNVYVGRSHGTESYPLAKINFIKRRDHRDGTGTLKIGYGVEKDSDGDVRPLTTDWPGIPDARRAEAIIRERAKWAQ